MLPEEDGIILSFLSPSIDEEVTSKHRGIVIQAREASLGIRASASELYFDLVARIGIVKRGNGLTLRQSIARPGESSLWWYHPVAFKDCESDPTFEWIIAVLTVRAVAEEFGLKKFVLVGAPYQVAAVLRTGFVIEELDTRRPSWAGSVWTRGLGSRIKYAVTALRELIAVRRRAPVPNASFDVALSSFWDWSVCWDGQAQSLTDRYFKRLPEELKQQGASVGWFAWFDPKAEPGKQDRSLEEVLEALDGREDVVILQSFLRPWDILRAVVDFHSLATFLSVRRRSAFKDLFQEEGLSYCPLFWEQLLRGFLDANLSHHSLVALATERIFRRYQPKVALSFLEHFPYSRAHYDGVSRVGIDTLCYAVQHASYSHEKTFLLLHPSVEFAGEPDGCAVPHPDYVCAMGTLGQELFLECGYTKDQVLLTGSPRYDHVRASVFEFSRNENNRLNGDREEIRLLMICGLDMNVELEMIGAACAAVRDMKGIRLSARSHPFKRVEQQPGFAQYENQIQVTQGALDEDLSQSDLILFTYSTVAEEALLKGMPVWQWLPLGSNGSALAEVTHIPQFGSVARLRESLLEFQTDPRRFTPEVEMREFALERLFYRGDGGAARRVSLACLTQIGQVSGQGHCNG